MDSGYVALAMKVEKANSPNLSTRKQDPTVPIVGPIDLSLFSARSLNVQTSNSGGAVFDKTGAYRYLLWRNITLDEFAGDDGNLLIVMLNPNTANETRNDPTIRRCIGFAKSWGFSRLEVVNLFAICAEKPQMLKRFENPIGLHNDVIIRERAARAGRIIVAWGNHGLLHGRDADVLLQLRDCHAFDCFGTTKVGAPRHPLYVRADYKPSRYRDPAQVFRDEI